VPIRHGLNLGNIPHLILSGAVLEQLHVRVRNADGVGGLVQHGGWFDLAVVVLHVVSLSGNQGQKH